MEGMGARMGHGEPRHLALHQLGEAVTIEAATVEVTTVKAGWCGHGISDQTGEARDRW